MKKSPATKRKSGGARAVDRKHRQRNAQRPSSYVKDEIKAFERAQVPGTTKADVLTEAVETLRVALRQATHDPGLPPEQKREQVNRIASSLVNAVDAKNMIDELGAELREAHALLTELRDAPEEPSADTKRAPAPSTH